MIDFSEITFLHKSTKASIGIVWYSYVGVSHFIGCGSRVVGGGGGGEGGEFFLEHMPLEAQLMLEDDGGESHVFG